MTLAQLAAIGAILATHGRVPHLLAVVDAEMERLRALQPPPDDQIDREATHELVQGR